jgi:hypothetical protein
MTYCKTAIYKYRAKNPAQHREGSMKYKLSHLESVRVNNLICQQKKRLLAAAIKDIMNIDLFEDS